MTLSRAISDQKEWTMDPDVAYALLAEFFAKGEEEDITNGEFEDIVAVWEGLDGWLKMGGHAPSAWDQRMRSR